MKADEWILYKLMIVKKFYLKYWVAIVERGMEKLNFRVKEQIEKGVFFMPIKKMIFTILFWVLVIFTASPGLCESNISPITGLWSGNNIMFNVSEDGTTITGINSPFPDGESLIVNLIGKDGNTINERITAEIPIRNGQFQYQQKYDNGTLIIMGVFSSFDHAFGVASFKGRLSANTVWNATPDPKNIPYSFTRKFSGHTKPVSNIKLTPDLKRVISGSDDKTIKIWEMDSGNILRTLKGHSKGINSLAISPDGKLLISADKDRKIIIWDLETYKKLRTIKDSEGVTSLIFMADGRQFASGTDNGVIKIWDINTGKPIRLLEGHCGTVQYLLITQDGKKLISSGKDCTIKIWDFENGSLLNTLTDRYYVYKLALSPDEKKLASVSSVFVKIWDLSTGKLLLTLTGHLHIVTGIAFTPDGKKIITGSMDDIIRICDLETGDLLKLFYAKSGGVGDIIALQDGKQFMAGLGDGTIKLWDLESVLSE